VPGEDDDPPPAADQCLNGDLGIIAGPKDPEAYKDPLDPFDPDSPAVRYLFGGVGPSDMFEIFLYDGYGVFAEGAEVGTFSIGDAEADPALCGLCVGLYLHDGDEEHRYLAVSGSVTLESTEERLTGKAAQLTFAEMNGPSSLADDGCSAKITSIAFDAVMIEPEI